MTVHLNCQHAIYAFDKGNSPVKRISAGTVIEIETYDCFENQIRSNDIPFHQIDWNRINPATGPIYVEGAESGDILAVTIQNIEIGDEGVLATGPNLGVMGHRISQFEVKMIPVQEGKAVFNDKVQIPLNPMIGVIGVAPSGDPVSCGTPGSHGGNMDNKMITTGATLYFPVFVDGALFALGDLHAAMGDGEIGVSGIEIPGKVTVKLDVIKGYSLQNPMLKNNEGLMTIVSAATLDEAVKQSVEEMIDHLLPHTDMSVSELTMLLSAIGQTQICQVVDPLLTARFFVPQWFLDAYEIELFN